MTTFTNSPHILKGGLVLIDPEADQVQRIISLQYNPESLTRTLQAQTAAESGDRYESLRLRGPAVETLRLVAENNTVDQSDSAYNGLSEPDPINCCGFGQECNGFSYPLKSSCGCFLQP